MHIKSTMRTNVRIVFVARCGFGSDQMNFTARCSSVVCWAKLPMLTVILAVTVVVLKIAPELAPCVALDWCGALILQPENGPAS